MKKAIVFLMAFVVCAYAQDVILESHVRTSSDSTDKKFLIGLSTDVPVSLTSIIKKNGKWNYYPNVSSGVSATCEMYRINHSNIDLFVYRPIIGAGITALFGLEVCAVGVNFQLGNIFGSAMYNFSYGEKIIMFGVQYNIPVFVELKTW